MNGIRNMDLAELLQDFTDGDDLGWDNERAWLEENHPRRLARIRGEIEGGVFPPVRLDFQVRSVVDGHHRIVAALQLGRVHVPVADAWDGSDWASCASGQGGDDPEVSAA